MGQAREAPRPRAVQYTPDVQHARDALRDLPDRRHRDAQSARDAQSHPPAQRDRNIRSARDAQRDLPAERHRERRRSRKLRPGDTVALIAPASPIYRNGEAPNQIIERARRKLHEAGLRTVVGEHAYDARGYLAGRDEDRARDVMAAFTNPNVTGIICLGGGYGTPRLLDLLDYDVIRANPKVFVGYSDITALLTAIGQRAGLVTFHGLMGWDLAPRSTAPAAVHAQAFTWEHFLRAVMRAEPIGELPLTAPWQSTPLHTVVPGTAVGPLAGGNLSLLANTLGTPYEVNTAGKILLIEEVGEAPYRIDRMLTQLRLAGKLVAAAGIIFAEWIDCEPERGRPSLSLEQVVADIIKPLGKPTVAGLAAGHGPGRLTLPLGVEVRIEAPPGETGDGRHPRIIVTEPGVVD